MAVEISTLLPLEEGTTITSSQVTMYTSAASTKAVVKFISIHNTHASTDETVTIWFLPSGQVVGTAYQRYKVLVYAGKTVDIPCSHVLNADCDIVVQGSVGAISSISISGFEITNAT